MIEQENNTYDKQHLLNIAASLEANSEHPIAKALLSANKPSINQHNTKQQTLLDVKDLKHSTGNGIQGKINNTEWFIGNEDFIQQHCTSHFHYGDNNTNKSSKIFLANKKHCFAIFILSDSIRPEAKKLIEKLHQENKETHLMSGDRIDSTKHISEQLGIKHFLGNLKPEDKLNNVNALQKQGAIVAMIGDGVNDAPVLAGANLSIAMGKGTQLAAATADMILISNNIEHIFHGYHISVKTLRIIKQNLTWALLYNVIAIPAAATGHVEPWLAAIGMSASSLVVVFNSMRLNRIKFNT